MSLSLTYPGVYIQEVDSGVRTIVGVPTAITAFIGRTRRGPLNDPVRISNFGDFDRQFGGLWEQSTVSYAVQQYFLNGGVDALIVRVHADAGADDRAGVNLDDGAGAALRIVASSPGDWGNHLRVIIDHNTRDAADQNLFNLIVQETDPSHPDPVIDRPAIDEERFMNVSRDANSPRFVTTVLEQESNLVRVDGAVPPNRPAASVLDPNQNPIPSPLVNGSDGNPIDADQISNVNLEADKEGIWALEKADIFNLLCIPPFNPDEGGDVDAPTWAAALAYCKLRRAVLLIDPPANWNEPRDAIANLGGLIGNPDENSAIYFPRIRVADPLKENRLRTFVPCGAVAGVISRTDAQRGVWKAPAGQDATLVGVSELTVKLTDNENGQLNPLGINCLRSFNVIGRVVWGARTTEGADRLASQWKYLPVRRLALYVEETLYRNTTWVVFEPNDEPLWSQIRLNIGSFMHNLFRQGAFQGTTPRDAYLVKCDRETTTQADIDRGIVNIVVGFAPLKPAEFVVIRIRQLAGQLEV
jgi:phage tail sheath protein FI